MEEVTAPLPLLPKRRRRVMTMKMIIKNYKAPLPVLSLQKSQISNGMMSLDSKVPKKLSRKLSSFLLSSQNFSKAAESLGQVSFCTDPQELVSLSSLKLVLPNVTPLSLQFLHPISSPNGKVSPKDSSKICSRWLERRSPP
jgi:hypothetical protein